MERQTQRKGGRPTKYKPEYADLLIEYFEEYVDQPFTKEVLRSEKLYYTNGTLKAEREECKLVAKKLPTLFGFSRSIGVDYSTVYRWTEARIGQQPEEGQKDRRPYLRQEFRNAYKTAQLYQTEYLTAVGLSGVAPAPFAIFTAKNVIGWRDALDQRFVDKDGKDRPAPSYVLLPTRKSGEDAASDYVPDEAAPEEAVLPGKK
jgi:hypothetical protein